MSGALDIEVRDEHGVVIAAVAAEIDVSTVAQFRECLLELADSELQTAMTLTQEELASLTGASRATVTRALSNWRRRGIIRTSQRDITITDLVALRKIAGQQS